MSASKQNVVTIKLYILLALVFKVAEAAFFDVGTHSDLKLSQNVFTDIPGVFHIKLEQFYKDKEVIIQLNQSITELIIETSAMVNMNQNPWIGYVTLKGNSHLRRVVLRGINIEESNASHSLPFLRTSKNSNIVIDALHLLECIISPPVPIAQNNMVSRSVLIYRCFFFNTTSGDYLRSDTSKMLFSSSRSTFESFSIIASYFVVPNLQIEIYSKHSEIRIENSTIATSRMTLQNWHGSIRLDRLLTFAAATHLDTSGDIEITESHFSVRSSFLEISHSCFRYPAMPVAPTVSIQESTFDVDFKVRLKDVANVSFHRNRFPAGIKFERQFSNSVSNSSPRFQCDRNWWGTSYPQRLISWSNSSEPCSPWYIDAEMTELSGSIPDSSHEDLARAAFIFAVFYLRRYEVFFILQLCSIKDFAVDNLFGLRPLIVWVVSGLGIRYFRKRTKVNDFFTRHKTLNYLFECFVAVCWFQPTKLAVYLLLSTVIWILKILLFLLNRATPRRIKNWCWRTYCRVGRFTNSHIDHLLEKWLETAPAVYSFIIEYALLPPVVTKTIIQFAFFLVKFLRWIVYAKSWMTFEGPLLTLRFFSAWKWVRTNLSLLNPVQYLRLLRSSISKTLFRKEPKNTCLVFEVDPACTVCLEASKTHLFNKCGHLAICEGCARDIWKSTEKGATTRCVICRKSGKIIRLFPA